MSKEIKIRFFSNGHNVSLINRGNLKLFLEKVITSKGKKLVSINYIFCSDKYLHQLNQEHLKHDTLTDIITFQLSAPDAPILSDIYISVPRVRENAGNFKVPFQHEIRRVLFHGALHLCG